MENRHDAQFRPQAEGVVMSAAPQPTAIQRWLIAVIAAFSILSLAMSGTAQAHEKKKHEQAQRAEQAKRAQQHVQQQGQSTTTPQGKAAAHDTAEMMDDMGMEMDRSQMSFFERIYSWFGRLHPLIVHFPIAFFPAALFTAIVGRKRPAFAAPVQFLVVAGGIFAPIAAAAGWLAGLGADPDPILNYHRWLGVAIGIAGAGLGAWAWRRPWEDRGAGMILALTLMTLAIAVQGFLGAGVTHGMDHLMF
jgi:uncharacterized membrane protein/preprotein translocase subunit SecG